LNKGKTFGDCNLEKDWPAAKATVHESEQTEPYTVFFQEPGEIYYI
jgi:hypothetical protein